MRAIVDAAAFAKALNHANRVIQKSAIPVLEGILIRFKDGRCSLTGMDMDTWLTVTLSAQGEDFAFVLQNPPAAAKACCCFNGELVLELRDAGSKHLAVTLTNGHRSGTFDVFPEEEYPLSPPLEEGVSFTVNAALTERIERVKYAVSAPQNLDGRVERICVQFCGNDVFGLDGYRAACDTDKALTFPRPFLIRESALSFLKLMHGSEATVRVGENHVWFSTDAVTVCAHREEAAPYPLWNAVPRSFTEEFWVAPKEFLRELEYLESFQPKKHRHAAAFCGGQLFLDMAESKCSTSVEIEGKSETVIGFDQRFMKDALNQFKDEARVKVMFSGRTGPIILEAEGRNDFALVLPVRLRGSMAA